MAHAFDSGLAKPQRTLVRERVAELLAELHLRATPPRYLRAIRQLPMALVGDGAEDFLVRAVDGQLPAVAIAVGERRFDGSSVDALEWRGVMTVHVYLVSAHQRDLVDGRTVADVVALADDTADPGLDVIGEHVFERLAGATVSNCTLRPLREDPLFVDAERTVFEQTYELALQTVVNPDRGIAETVTDIDTTHDEDAAGEPAQLETLTTLEAP